MGATVPMLSNRSGKLPKEEDDLCICISHLNVLDFQLDIRACATTDDSVFREDQILRAVHTMRVERIIPTWTVLALQILVETRRELGTHLSRGLEDLREAWAWLHPTWTACLDTDRTRGIRNIEQVCYKPVKEEIARMSELLDEDFMQGLLDDQMKHQPKDFSNFNRGSYFFFRNHPLVCGLWLQESLVVMHSYGTRMAAGHGPIETAIHLSQAVSLAGLNPAGGSWSDLEYIINKHGATYMFVGERPDNLCDCFNRMRIAFGVGVSLLSRNKKNEIDYRDIKSDRGIRVSRRLGRHILPISRYVSIGNKTNGTGYKWDVTRAARDPFVMMEALVNRINGSKDVSRPADPLNENTSEVQRSLTPLQSLEIFKRALKEDDLPLRFDLMNLNWRCLKLLRRIQKVCVKLSPHVYSAFKSDDRYLKALVSHMLGCVLGSEHEQPHRFHETCNLVHGLVTREGNVESLAAQARLGIVKGAAKIGEDESEDFEVPMTFFSTLFVDRIAGNIAKSESRD